MSDAHEFLKALTIVLGVAGVTTVVFQRLRQPVVLGYLLAGLIVGPHVPVPLVADVDVVQTLSELGVILVMFALGLELSLAKIRRIGPASSLTALVETSITFWLGFVAGRALGWALLESVFIGAIVAISSTTIVARAFDELGVDVRLRERAVGVLVVEDLVAVALLAVLTAAATGAGVSPGALAATVVQLAVFLLSIIAGGMLIIPRVIRLVHRLQRPETLLIATLGICFALAYLALRAGYSVALGAFLAGTLVAESGEREAIERLVTPVRDVFAAIFFVSVGMLIDPAVIARHGGAVALFTVLVLVGKIAGVSFGAFLTGSGTRAALQTGMSLAQIGEFSFIIAALGTTLGPAGSHLYPVAVGVSAVTALTTPWLIRLSGPAAELLDRKLPRSVQTAVSLYGSWLEQMGKAGDRATVGARVRRTARVLALDAAVVAALVITTAVLLQRGSSWLRSVLGTDEPVARTVLVAAAAALSLPFVAGLGRNSRRLGLLLAETALPHATRDRPDLAAAPRRTLVAMLQLGAALLVLLPILAVTQPFLPGVPGAAVLVAVLVVLGVGFWRSATNLQGHVRAGAQVIAEALARQSGAQRRKHRDVLAEFRAMFPGMGDPITVSIPPGAACAGHTISAMSIRGVTGATVLAIARPDGAVMIPGPGELLHPGDVLALAGTGEAVDAARELLTRGRRDVKHASA